MEALHGHASDIKDAAWALIRACCLTHLAACPVDCSWGGRGRAGVVGACLLAHLYGLSADEALERVQRSFDTRKDGGRRSPETDEQHAFVREWIAQRQA